MGRLTARGLTIKRGPEREENQRQREGNRRGNSPWVMPLARNRPPPRPPRPCPKPPSAEAKDGEGQKAVVL